MATRLPNFFDTNIKLMDPHNALMGGPGLPLLDVAIPSDLSRPEVGWTPEHYFVAAIESGLMRTFLAMTAGCKLGVKSYRSQSRAKLEWVETRGYRITHIGISPEIVVYNESDVDRALSLMDKAEKHCLALRSIHAPVLVTSTVSAERPSA